MRSYRWYRRPAVMPTNRRPTLTNGGYVVSSDRRTSKINVPKINAPTMNSLCCRANACHGAHARNVIRPKSVGFPAVYRRPRTRAPRRDGFTFLGGGCISPSDTAAGTRRPEGTTLVAPTVDGRERDDRAERMPRRTDARPRSRTRRARNGHTDDYPRHRVGPLDDRFSSFAPRSIASLDRRRGLFLNIPSRHPRRTRGGLNGRDTDGGGGRQQCCPRRRVDAIARARSGRPVASTLRAPPRPTSFALVGKSPPQKKKKK